MLYTKDLQGTLDFYVETLGFTCKHYDADLAWASLAFDTVEIMLSRPNEHFLFEKPLFTGSFYFTVADVDIIWRGLESKANICYPIEHFDYGMREFAIYDNNGYLLQFGQEIQ